MNRRKYFTDQVAFISINITMNDIMLCVGPISWRMMTSGRAVSVYNSGKGFIIKIHDQLGFKFRSSHYNGEIVLVNTYSLI